MFLVLLIIFLVFFFDRRRGLEAGAGLFSVVRARISLGPSDTSLDRLRTSLADAVQTL